MTCTSCFLFSQSFGPPGPEWRKQLNVVRHEEMVEPQTARLIHLVSWNVDHGENLESLASALAKDGADLCLLQEVDWGTARTNRRDIPALLAQRLRLNFSYGIEFEELSQERSVPAFTGQATLTRFPVQKSRILRFEQQSGFWKPRDWIPSAVPLMQRRLGGRLALISELMFDGKLLVVYNAHLESRSYGRIQNEQLDEMLSDLEKNYPANTAVIMGGDFNTKYFPTWFLRKLEDEGFRSATGKHVARTHKIAFALDWIFVRGPVDVESGGLEKSWKGSDHYALQAELVSTTPKS